jgi:hypothetical protein
LAGLRRHLDSKDGRLQVEELLGDPAAAALEHLTQHIGGLSPLYASYSRAERLKYVRKVLLQECGRVIRLLETRNYDVKHPPQFVVCPTQNMYHNNRHNYITIIDTIIHNILHIHTNDAYLI